MPLKKRGRQAFVIRFGRVRIRISRYCTAIRNSSVYIRRLLVRLHPSWGPPLHDAVRPAYSALLREVNAARGKTLDRVTIQRLIEQSLKDATESSEVRVVRLRYKDSRRARQNSKGKKERQEALTECDSIADATCLRPQIYFAPVMKK